jgi:DNA mismatch endonuclease, patch repair protein
MSDNLTRQQRSYCMGRVRNRDTDLERVVRSALHRRGLRFRKHVSGLPGRPDVVFPAAKVAVFIDGDFWHGYRFPLWNAALSPFWQRKIATNRERDARNFRRLRRRGWTVVRVWQHATRSNLDGVVARIAAVVITRQSPADRSARAGTR